MSDTEVTEWVKLLQVGGNAGIIVLTIVAVKVAQAFLAALRGIRDELATTRQTIVAGQEQIKRAIVSIQPKAEEQFRQGAG